MSCEVRYRLTVAASTSLAPGGRLCWRADPEHARAPDGGGVHISRPNRCALRLSCGKRDCVRISVSDINVAGTTPKNIDTAEDRNKVRAPSSLCACMCAARVASAPMRRRCGSGSRDRPPGAFTTHRGRDVSHSSQPSRLSGLGCLSFSQVLIRALQMSLKEQF